MIIRKIAERIAEHHSRVEQVALDPATILIIAAAITVALKAFQECQNKPEDAYRASRMPTGREKVFIGKALREASGNKLATLKTLRLRRAFFEVAKTLTQEEITAAFNEAPVNNVI